MNKFDSLKEYLLNNGGDTITLSLTQLEEIIGEQLSDSARKHRAHSIAKAWLEAGYRVVGYDQFQEVLNFEKIKDNQSYLLSSELFVSLLEKGETPAGFFYISVFSLYECISLWGIFQKEAFDFIQANGIKIIDLNGKLLDFEMFASRGKAIETSLKNLYNSVIKYSLLNCLINSFDDSKKREQLFELFSKESSSYLFIDFPISANKKIGQPLFESKLKSLLDISNIELSYDWAISAFSKLEYKEMSIVMVSGLTNMETNYLNYMMRNFIDTCKRQTPYIDFTLINEMLNMDIVSLRKELIYWTTSDQNFEVLLGSIKNRVIRKEVGGN